MHGASAPENPIPRGVRFLMFVSARDISASAIHPPPGYELLYYREANTTMDSNYQKIGLWAREFTNEPPLMSVEDEEVYDFDGSVTWTGFHRLTLRYP